MAARVIDIARVRRGRAMLDAAAQRWPELVSGRRAGALAEWLERLKEGDGMTDDGRAAWGLSEAAAMLGLHPQTLRRAIHAGELKALKLHKHYRVSRTELASWWRERGGGELFAPEAPPVGAVNGEGLTLAEWRAAAGPKVDEATARAAWAAGEDPTEYRAEG